MTYPPGKCPYCGKVFERIYRARMSETESFHVKGCQLKEIERKINEKEYDEFTVGFLLDELQYISKVSSFGARNNPKNKYYERMLKCIELEKRLK